MVQTRSKARVVGAPALWTGVSSNSAGPSRNQHAPKAAAPTTAAPARPTVATTTNARSRKTTRKGGKSRGVAKAPRGRGRAATARPAATAPPPPNASAAAPTTAEASTQTDDNCSTCELLVRRLGRRDDTIKALKARIERLEAEKIAVYESFMAETRCHEAANAEIERLGGNRVDRSTPEDERLGMDLVET